MLARARDAIEEAVKEASALPASERRRKLNALRLKWHPDKHAVLGEMAAEVTKMINEAVERHAAPTGPPLAADDGSVRPTRRPSSCGTHPPPTSAP